MQLPAGFRESLGVLVVALVLLGSFGAVGGSGSPPGARPMAGAGPGPRSEPPLGGAVGEIEINVSNGGFGATGPYEQMVVLNSSRYSNLINSNFSNVLAFYVANDQPIYTWIESGASNASSSTVLWLRLDSIPAESTVQVVLECLSKTSFTLSENGYMGESPQLSPTYAQFDNGWRVFDFYDNFSGARLNPKLWSVNGGGGTWSTYLHDGVHIDSVPGGGANITSQLSYRYPFAVDFYGNLYQTTAATAYLGAGAGDSACTSCFNAMVVGWDSEYASNGPTPFAAYTSSGAWGSSVDSRQQFGVFTTVCESTTDAAYALNYSDVATPSGISFAIPPSPQRVALALSGSPSGTLTNNVSTTWIRERPVVNDTLVVVDPQEVAPLTAAFVASPATVGVNSTVAFLTDTSGGLPPLTYNFSGLPAGCSAQDVPVFSCVVRQAGRYDPTVLVTDALGGQSTAVANLTVLAPPPPPPPPPAPPLRVALFAVPGSPQVNRSFTLLAVPSGGLPPYQFAYAGLPAGCAGADTGSLNCTPTATGAASIRVTVTDSNGTQVSNSTTVEVGPATLAPLRASLEIVPGTVLANQTASLVAFASGGRLPYTYSFANLPADCATQDTPILECSSALPGQYTVLVTVRDAEGNSTSATASYAVDPGPHPGGVAPLGAGGVPTWEFDAALAGLVVAAAAAVVIFLVGRRRSASPPTE